MKFGLTEAQWVLVNTLAIEILKKDKGRVWVFGSRARGDHREFSDLDLLYDSSTVTLGTISQIKEHLENSDLPIKVDLVNLRDLANAYKDDVMKNRIEL